MMSTLISLPSIRRVVAVVVVALGAFTGAVTSAASEDEALLGPIDRPDVYTYEVLSIDDAVERLATAEAYAERVRSSTEVVLIEYSDLVSTTAELSESSTELVTKVANARRDARTLAVDAFIFGGPMSNTRTLLATADANELAWRNYLLIEQSLERLRAATRLEELRLTSSAELFDLGSRTEDVEARLDAVQEDRDRSDADVGVAATELVIAQAWQRASDTAASSGRPGASDQAWEALRHCESRGDYAAVSPSGTYRGAYQFDMPTWITVGGTGDPIHATPEEQDARARVLFALRGRAPWPNCGPKALP